MSSLDDALRYEMLAATKAIEISEPKRATEMLLRRSRYRPRIDRKPQCPICWARQERQSPMTPIAGDDRFDYLRCDYCACELAAPV